MAYVSGTEEAVGRTSEEFINEPLETFLHPDDKEEAVAFFESLQAGRDGRVQARFKHGDESWVWIETTGTTVSDSSMIGGAITISRDITQRKRRERHLERQNERLDRFASVVSHYLRNQLGVATGYAEIAEETGDAEGSRSSIGLIIEWER